MVVVARYYILNSKKEPVPAVSALAWAEWWENNREACVVAQEKVGGYFVSTVFLGINHDHLGQGVPILFETASQAASDDGTLEILARYSTWEQAEEGHKKAVRSVKLALSN